ncbi:MAG: PAS domain S-box protein [Verrucomicrobiia bacterium]
MTIPILVVGGFLLDLLTPLGIADWVLYVIPLLFALYVGSRWLPYVLAAILSMLLLAGYYLSPPGVDPSLAFISRLIGVGVLWLTALMIWHHKKTVAHLHKLSRAVEHSQDSIVITDKAGNIEYVNPKFTDLTGYALDEVIGKNPRILKSGEMPPEKYKQLWKTIQAGGEWHGEFHNRKKNGELYWESASISSIADDSGKITHYLAVKEDITEHKKNAEALSSEQRLLSSLITTTPDLVYFKDRESRFIRINEAFARRAGLSDIHAAVGKTDFDIFGEQHARQAYEDEQRIVATGQPIVDKEEREDWTDGRITWASSTKLPIFDSSGKTVGIMGVSRDITERKQTEEALARERNLLRTIFDVLPDYIYLKDEQSRFIMCNNRRSDNDAIQDAEELIGKTDADFFPAEQAAQFRADELAVLGGTPMIDKEEALVRSDGRRQIILTTKLPFRDSSGKIVGLLGYGRDITDRKRAEEALQESQSLYHSLVEQLPIGVFRKDEKGRYILVNHLFCQLKGMKPEEFLGKTPQEIAAAQVLKQGATGLATKYATTGAEHHEQIMLTGKPIELVEEYVLADGRRQFLHAMKWPVFDADGKIIGTQGIQLDISELRRSEEHVREQAALLDKAQDAIFVLDLNDRITYWNKGAEHIYGWTAAEAIGKSSLELLHHGILTPQLANTIKTVDERGEWAGEMQESTKDGKTVTVQGRCNLIRDEQGRPKSRLIINTDITERKNLELQFLRSQRMEGIGALAGGIAHDLNNILTPLLVAVQVLKDKISDEDGRKLLQSLETNVQRGAGLVKQVLAFGRGVTGERIVVNPKHIAREIKQIIYATFPKSLEFELHTTPELWTITGDPTQLHQILLNLCVNARDAMPQGGKLSLDMDNVKFDDIYASMNPEAKAGPYVCIKVTDTGTGIPKDIQDKIFDPFFTTKEPGKGTGLGLSTTLTIVKSHGGFVHCHSAPGHGSIFEVYLPANATAAGAENKPPEESRLPRGHDELVLVVDDEESIRNLALKVLQRYGYRVLLAADGAEAVSLYSPRQREIAAVITDMVMPIMDGPATIIALKAMNADVKIVSSSGMASEGGMAKARDAGVRYFIPKPYTAETMLTTLQEVLHGNHAPLPGRTAQRRAKAGNGKICVAKNTHKASPV